MAAKGMALVLLGLACGAQAAQVIQHQRFLQPLFNKGKGISYQIPYDTTYQTPYETTYQTPYETTYQKHLQPIYQQSYETSYQKVYEPTYQKTYQPTYQKAYQPVYQPAPAYDFEYGVNDPSYDGPSFGATETRDDNLTKGSYFVDLPDGRRQKVSYYVSEDSGFVADVSYEQIYEKPKYIIKTIEPSYAKASYLKPVEQVTFIPDAPYQEIPAPPPQLAKPFSSDSDEGQQEDDKEEAEGGDRKRSAYISSYPLGGASYSYVSVPGGFGQSLYKRAVEEFDPYNIEAAGYL